MADLPILMSAPMVRALLDGRKTQTRLVLPNKPVERAIFQGIDRDGKALFTAGCFYGKQRLPYAHGDRLYVREAVRFCSQMDGIKPSGLSRHESRLFDADGFIYEPACMMVAPGKLRPPRHMPRWASRITLTVTDVRVQRLHQISEADAIAEGCRGYVSRDGEDGLSPQEEYRTLWDQINGPGAWAENPWVAAYTFTVARGNIDQPGAC